MRYAQVIRELFRKKVLREYKFLQIPLRKAPSGSVGRHSLQDRKLNNSSLASYLYKKHSKSAFTYNSLRRFL